MDVSMSQMDQIEMGPPATNGKHQLSINKSIIKIVYLLESSEVTNIKKSVVLRIIPPFWRRFKISFNLNVSAAWLNLAETLADAAVWLDLFFYYSCPIILLPAVQ